MRVYKLSKRWTNRRTGTQFLLIQELTEVKLKEAGSLWGLYTMVTKERGFKRQ